MRENIRNLIEISAKEFDLMEPIVEIGSFQVPGQEELANLRPIFPGKQFIGCDMRHGNGVDRIENVECLSFENESIGTILIMDTLEHVENCFNALDEIYRVLKKDGVVIMSSVMDFPIHDYPSDYWRFTPEAFKLLLKKFPIKIIGVQGNPEHPHTVYGIGLKSQDFEKYKFILNRLNSFSQIRDNQKLVDRIKNKYIKANIIIRCLFDQSNPRFQIFK